MTYTKHAQTRFAQRGISKSMISIVMDYGYQDYDQNRWTLGTRQLKKIIVQLQEDIRLLKKIQDKGGLTVIETNNHILTAWCN